MRFFVNGSQSQTNPKLDMPSARLFFQNNTFPKSFFRRAGAFGLGDIGSDIAVLAAAHPVPPGKIIVLIWGFIMWLIDIWLAGTNQGAGNYVPDPHDKGLAGGQWSLN